MASNDRRVVRVEERRTLVLVTDVAQRDEPPGRGEWRREEVVLAQKVATVPLAQVAGHVAGIMEVV